MGDTGVPAVGHSRLRRWAIAATVVVVAALGLGTIVVAQHHFDLAERRISFVSQGNRLSGILATPTGRSGPFGLVVMVHGDGPATAAWEQSGISYYRPLWETFARAGYATLAWDKPGVGGSSGNWLRQSMADRATEVADALTWARSRSDLDSQRIGLWGGSQAGWVLPKVAVLAPHVRWIIAVSPAVNWRQQGDYLLRARLEDQGASEVEAARAIRRQQHVRELIERDATFDQYRTALGDEATMTPDRWVFVKRNDAADATDDLRAVGRIGTRMLLILAGHDRNVDVADTERVYRQVLAVPQLRVRRHPEADHAMLRYHLLRSEPRCTLTALFAPRSLFAPGFLDGQRDFIVSQSSVW